MKKRWWICIAAVVVLLPGCSSHCQYESQVTVKTIFTEAKPVHIVVNTQPYVVTDAALSSLRSFFSDSLGLETEVSRVNLEGVTKSDSTQQNIFDAAVPVLKEAKEPTLVIFVVKSIHDFHGGGLSMGAETRYESGEHYPVCVVALEHGWFLENQVESYLLKHEVGHWVGVPAGECHKLKNNPSHCSSLRCVMMPGPGSDPLRCCVEAVLAVLFLGPPDFCDDCKAELAAMEKQHEQIRSGVKPAPIE
jgi:hypothetical protein